MIEMARMPTPVKAARIHGPALPAPYFALAWSECPFGDFTKEVVLPGRNQKLPDGAVGVRVDGDFWAIACLPISYRYLPIGEIVATFWPDCPDPQCCADHPTETWITDARRWLRTMWWAYVTHPVWHRLVCLVKGHRGMLLGFDHWRCARCSKRRPTTLEEYNGARLRCGLLPVDAKLMNHPIQGEMPLEEWVARGRP